MKNKSLLFLSTVIGLLVCLQLNGQNTTTIRELIGAKKDTIVKGETESYHFKYGSISSLFRNVKNKRDTVHRKYNSDAGIASRTENKKLLQSVFSQERMDELAKSNASFVIQLICDTTGKMLECKFFIASQTQDLKLEEIEKFEKMMKKDFKVTYSHRVPGVEDYELTYLFRFGTPPVRNFQKREKPTQQQMDSLKNKMNLLKKKYQDQRAKDAQP